MSKGKGKKLRHISVDAADNGVKVQHSFDEPQKTGGMDIGGPQNNNVFTNPSEASAHVTNLIHGHFAAMKGGNDNDGDEMPEHFKKATPRFTNRKPSY